jgi:hypothetical protein
MPLHRGTLALILQAGIPAITTFLSVLVLTAAFLIGTNKTLNQDLEPNQVCSTCRFLQRE